MHLLVYKVRTCPILALITLPEHTPPNVETRNVLGRTIRHQLLGRLVWSVPAFCL